MCVVGAAAVDSRAEGVTSQVVGDYLRSDGPWPRSGQARVASVSDGAREWPGVEAALPMATVSADVAGHRL
jgi:hypothetical protein